MKGTLNYLGLPLDLTFYGTPNCLNIDCQANNDKYLTVYAPQANVSLAGNADIFGAITAYNIDVNGTFQFHYDESLATNSEPTISHFEMVGWREL
jgi:hypothetical protein